MTETLEQNATSETRSRDTSAVSPQAPKLLDQVRERIRVLHYSLATEKTYCYWILTHIPTTSPNTRPSTTDSAGLLSVGIQP